MKGTRRILGIVLAILISTGMTLGIDQTAQAETILINVGQTRQILLDATLTTGKLTSGSWSSSDGRIAKITSQNAGFCDVMGVSSGTATITCRYRYYVGGTYITSSWSCSVKVSGTGGGSSSGGGSGSSYVTMSCNYERIKLDLAKGTGKQLVFNTDGNGSTPIFLSIDVRKGWPKYVSFNYSLLSENDSPVFINGSYRSGYPQKKTCRCTLYPKGTGSEIITFQIVTERVVNGYARYYNTGYQTVDVDVEVICSHEFGDGVVLQQATETQNEIREYTCQYCGETQEVEILPEIEASAQEIECAYDGQAHGITVNVTKPESGATVRYGTAEGACNMEESPTITDVNESPLVVYYEASAEGFSDKTGSATITINKANLSSEVILPGWTYGEKANTPSVTGNQGNGEVSYTYKEKNADNSTFSEKLPDGVGDYIVKAVIAETDNYNGGEATAEFSISKASSNPTAPTARTLTYTGEPQALVTEGTATGGTFCYALTDRGAAAPADSLYTAAIPVATNVGTYHVWYKVIGDDNHNGTEPDKVEVKISPADKTALNDAIAAAEAYYKDIADYTDIVAKLKTAVDAAKAVAGTDNVTEAVVARAVTALNGAVDAAKADVKQADDKKAAEEEAAKTVKITKCKIKVNDVTYTGKAVTAKAMKKAVIVKYDGKKLKYGTDYTLSYSKKAKAIGAYKVTIKGKGNFKGSKKLPFNIVPKGTAFSKLTGGKQQITLKWKKQKNINGYEIQYGLKKDFKGAKTVKIKKAKTLITTIKKLKAKTTYYVRIRTFTTVKKKNYHSAWSKAKTVKTAAGKAKNASAEQVVKTSMNAGEALDLKEMLPGEISDFEQTWESNDADIATVSGDGVVKALKAGEVIITMTNGDGEKVVFTVTVNEAELLHLDLSDIEVIPIEDEELMGEMELEIAW